MLIVKKIENGTKDGVNFEVITRSPFTGECFTLSESMFRELFKCVGNDTINPNASNEKADIYQCADKIFYEKMKWWNSNIDAILPLHHTMYNLERKVSVEDHTFFEDMKDEYKIVFKEDAFTFLKDLKFYNKFFNTAS